MERITTDAEDNCGLGLVESDVLFEKLGGYSLQFTIQDMINTTVAAGKVTSSEFKTEKEARNTRQEMDSLLIPMTKQVRDAGFVLNFSRTKIRNELTPTGLRLRGS